MAERLLANPVIEDAESSVDRRTGRPAVTTDDRRRRLPGSNCEHDVVRAPSTSLGARAPSSSGTATPRVGGFDAVVLPGGFAHGDYLRPGAIARFSPVMEAVADFAAAGGPVARHLQRLPGPHRGRPAARVRCRRTVACSFLCTTVGCRSQPPAPR